MPALGVPGVLTPAAPAPGGSGGASNFTDLYIDDVVAPSTPSALVPNRLDSNLLGLDGYWQDPTVLFNTSAITAPADGEGSYISYNPGSSNGQEAYIQGPSNLTPGPGCDFWCKFRFDDADRSRLWLGYFANAATGLALRTGDPTQQHAALRFQNGDVNFQFISKDGSTQEITDTLVTPTNDTVYYLRIKVRAASVEFTLYDSNLSVLAGPDTHVTNIPGADDELRPTLYSGNDGVNDNRDLQIYSCHLVQHHLP